MVGLCQSKSLPWMFFFFSFFTLKQSPHFSADFSKPGPLPSPRSKDELQEKVQTGDLQVRTVPVQARHGDAQHR